MEVDARSKCSVWAAWQWVFEFDNFFSCHSNCHHHVVCMVFLPLNTFLKHPASHSILLYYFLCIFMEEKTIMCGQSLSWIKNKTKQIACTSLCKACSFSHYFYSILFSTEIIRTWLYFPKQGVLETKVTKLQKKKNRKLPSRYECVVSAQCRSSSDWNLSWIKSDCKC